mmetsp:Transcript_7802/g.12389  ORF Transcript_7802/g.12389 Transcript_7802/m.12389 type:complete len:142 (-) Transcript_7802:1459-1884(-)
MLKNTIFAFTILSSRDSSQFSNIIIEIDSEQFWSAAAPPSRVVISSRKLNGHCFIGVVTMHFPHEVVHNKVLVGINDFPRGHSEVVVVVRIDYEGTLFTPTNIRCLWQIFSERNQLSVTNRTHTHTHTHTYCEKMLSYLHQ